MNYIWDMAIKAARQGINNDEITFVFGDSCSPYMELAFEDINTATLIRPPVVEINPYYRFCDIFKQLSDINFDDYEELKAVFFDTITHYLLFIDRQQGLNKREYYSKFIHSDMKNGVFGEEIAENLDAFTSDELNIVISGVITLYRTHASIHLLKQVIRSIFSNSIIYFRGEETAEVLIYLGSEETAVYRQKINTILSLFLPLGFKYRLYWDKHFGIVDVDVTMHADSIVIY